MTAALYGLFLSLILAMRVAPRTPLGAWLLHHLVREPLAKVSAMERHQLIYAAIVLVMLMGAGETLATYGTFEWAMISAFDLAVYLDAVAVTTVLVSMARIRSAGPATATWWAATERTQPTSATRWER